jgi:hypothetical protein
VLAPDLISGKTRYEASYLPKFTQFAQL